MVLPFSTPWLIATLCALVFVNYKLLRNKYHFMIDCAFVLLLGSFFVNRNGGPGSPYTAKQVLDLLLLFLTFATMRILFRQELYDLFKKTLPHRRRCLILACIAFLIVTWAMVIRNPRPVLLSTGTLVRSNLKNLGSALEMYATDHQGAYPSTLKELSPEYLKNVSRTDQELTEKERKFYEKKFGLTLDYGYEVDNRAQVYTITCNGDITSYHPHMYTSKEGLVE